MHGKQSAQEQKRIEELARVNRFEGFTDEEIHQVVETATYLTVPANWALMVEQQPADKAYLILTGEVSVRRNGEEVARLGAGEVMGEMALVNHKLRSATVVADTPLEVLHFTAETVAALTAKIPHFRDALIGAVEERIPHDQGS
ncbi:MAG TPA: cyclic nucleotide-binding domain-containing protein [Marmoricola sp.]|jgi:CRP-like cAMP-binding protein|nr:cyclic nucleotide-binding domain-containing protein [Marmoricola sp.]